jgi:parallel beta-helix repeat protein
MNTEVMDEAVWIQNAKNINFFNNTIKHCGIGAHADSSHSNYFNNTITFNKDVGLIIYGKFNNITHNLLSYNIYDGLSLNGFNQTVTYNILNNNSNDGISVKWGSNNNTIFGNICNFNKEYGAYMFDVSHQSFISNTLYNNEKKGISAWYCSNSEFIKNIANNNSKGPGISFFGSSYNTIHNNTFNNNSEYGIFLDMGSSNNVISSNKVLGNVNGCIYICSNCFNNQLVDNYCDETDETEEIPGFNWIFSFLGIIFALCLLFIKKLKNLLTINR